MSNNVFYEKRARVCIGAHAFKQSLREVLWKPMFVSKYFIYLYKSECMCISMYVCIYLYI